MDHLWRVFGVEKESRSCELVHVHRRLVNQLSMHGLSMRAQLVNLVAPSREQKLLLTLEASSESPSWL